MPVPFLPPRRRSAITFSSPDRFAEVAELDVVIENGAAAYRSKVKVSFKYEDAD
jgi:flavin-binding protein dodecin